MGPEHAQTLPIRLRGLWQARRSWDRSNCNPDALQIVPAMDEVREVAKQSCQQGSPPSSKPEMTPQRVRLIIDLRRSGGNAELPVP